MKAKRVFFFVLDSVGVGAMPDAAEYGDGDVNTLKHIAKTVGGLNLPTLEKMGLGHLTEIKGVAKPSSTIAAYGKAAEKSKGKDTTTGHWEFMGIEVSVPFPTYPQGFPKEFIDCFVAENSLPGVLGNKAASGTVIIEELGEKHLASEKPIVYTSADSVFQIACHEETFGLDRLYSLCKNARKQCNEINVSRVIARPFLGANAKAFKRTGNRKDYSIELPAKTALDHLLVDKFESISIGKVASIYGYTGFSKELKASSNQEIFNVAKKEAERNFTGLLFANFVDFDMLYGHRRNPRGYAKELEWFDAELRSFIKSMMREDDLLILSADHGNDPTAPGSDHTREYVPIIAYTKVTENSGGKALGTRTSFADIGQTILDALGSSAKLPIGQSFWQEMRML